MVTLNLFLDDLPPERRIMLMEPKPGSFIVVRMVEGDNRAELEASIEAIRDAMSHIGRMDDCAVIITTLQHDIRLLGDDDMERLGWVRKEKETT